MSEAECKGAIHGCCDGEGEMTPKASRAEAPAFEVHGLTKRYAGVLAMDDISFSLAPGQVHALVGENGAGKSTLVKSLAGAVRPDAGQMTLFGQPYAPKVPADALRTGVGVVFQELSLIPDLTVAQNIWFGREQRTRAWTIEDRALERATRELFDKYELEGVPPHARVRDLSVSQRQLVEIVKVISTDPRIFVLDEATSALSPREVEWTHNRAQQLASEGASVIYISHRLAEARQVASEVTIFRAGKNVRTAQLADVPDDELIYLMLGRRVDHLYPPKATEIGEESLLSVRDLTVGTRVRGVDFDIKKGEILGVGGIQGQGQLELFLALYGILPGSGEVSVSGQRVSVNNPRQALKAKIGLALVPEDRQNDGLFLPLSIRENIVLPTLSRLARLGFITQRRERRAITDVVKRLKIAAGNTEQSAGSLSGGNQQKVVIAKFLLTQARVYCLYDLTRGVDVGTKAEIFDLMRNLASSGAAVLFYSTELAELVNVADRVAVMADGQVRGFLAGDELTEAGILRLALSGSSTEKAGKAS